MIITVASFKGGVGKTTTAVHLAAFFQGRGKTLLIDADPNRSALGWARRGELPFTVMDEWQAEAEGQACENIIIDTQARPTPNDLATLASTCDLLVLPTLPDILSLDALVLTIECLQAIRMHQYRILVTCIPPRPSRAGEEVQHMLQEANLPIFNQGIRRLAAFQKAAMDGVPVYAVKDSRAELGWQDYTAVGDEIVALEAACNTP